MAGTQPLPDPPARASIGSTIAAHLDVGTIVTGIIGFLMVFLIQSGVNKLDKLTDQVGSLNEKMVSVITRAEYQERKDLAQDTRLDKHHDRLQHIEDALARFTREK